jgi:hypothetical protein
MKDQSEAIKYYAPGQYLVTLVAKQPEVETIDEFMGWEGDRPLYGGCEIIFNPTYHVSVVVDKMTSEIGMKLQASYQLMKEGFKNRVKDFDFSFRTHHKAQF